MPSIARSASRRAAKTRSGVSNTSSSFRSRTGPIVGSMFSAMQASVGVIEKDYEENVERPTPNAQCLMQRSDRRRRVIKARRFLSSAFDIGCSALGVRRFLRSESLAGDVKTESRRRRVRTPLLLEEARAGWGAVRLLL